MVRIRQRRSMFWCVEVELDKDWRIWDTSEEYLGMWRMVDWRRVGGGDVPVVAVVVVGEDLGRAL